MFGSYPSIRGTSLRSWETTRACSSGEMIRGLCPEDPTPDMLLDAQMMNRVSSKTTKQPKKNQCCRRNFKPESRIKYKNFVASESWVAFLQSSQMTLRLIYDPPFVISSSSLSCFPGSLPTTPASCAFANKKIFVLKSDADTSEPLRPNFSSFRLCSMITNAQ